MNSFFSRFENHADLMHQWRGQPVIGLVGEAPSTNRAQNAAWNYLLQAFDLKAIYLPFDLNPLQSGALEKLACAISDAQASDKLLGLKVAPPYKEPVFELMRRASYGTALRLGVINTIGKKNGALACFNTDGVGMYHNLMEAFGECSGKSFLILGSGGAAATIADELIQHARKIIIAARNTVASASLHRLLMRYHPQKLIETISLEEVPHVIGGVDCVINTTPVGRQGPFEQFSALVSTDIAATENVAASIEIIKALPPSVCFASTLYRPDKELLLQQAEQRGHRVVNGQGMWLYQAAVAAQEFFPEALSTIPVSHIASALREGMAIFEHGERKSC